MNTPTRIQRLTLWLLTVLGGIFAGAGLVQGSLLIPLGGVLMGLSLVLSL